MGDFAPEPAVVPGAEAPQDSSSAGTINTVPPAGGPPEAIPYARFKEVNDQLRPWKEIEQAGYDPNSVGQLVRWEQQFSNDPVGNWLSIAQQIEDLPDNIKEAVAAHLGGGSDESDQYADDEEYEDTEPPEWARPLLQKYEAEQKAEEENAKGEVLDWMLGEWHKQNVTQKLPPIPPQVMLGFIAGAAGTGSTAEEILAAARQDWLNVRAMSQAEVIKPGDPRSTGASVSGSAAATTGAPPPRPKSFEEMNQLIAAAERSGTLPGG